MTINQVIERISEIKIIPVVRASSVDEAKQAVEAISEGGIPIVEITMTVPDAINVIQQVVKKYEKDVLTGAGTVLNSAQAKACIDAGAEFLVSPGLSVPVLSTALAMKKLAIPGILTPTELMTASENGVTMVKVFPCGNVGGPKYIKSLRGPFPNIRMIPTGGVNAQNAADYMNAGAFAVGVGADLVDVSALRAGRTDKVTAAARELVQAVQDAGQGKHSSK
jgi:2-dehydro-3-deoxyphosphogluconate aldolase/(4S)-4-hydroxy-2-oxoglutarate aldolase